MENQSTPGIRALQVVVYLGMPGSFFADLYPIPK